MPTLIAATLTTGFSGAVIYVPADPLNVTSVANLVLYAPSDLGRVTPIVTVTTGVAQTDGSWRFTVPTQADGIYPASFTVTTTGGVVTVDSSDSLTFPFSIPAAPGDPIALWTQPATLRADSRFATLTDAQLISACRFATNQLWRLTGRRFHGPRVATIKVSHPDCGCGWFPNFWDSYATYDGPGFTGGGWYGGGPFGWGCGCDITLTLPHSPVRAILDVTVDGTLAAATAYRLDQPNVLTRLDGPGWPLTGDARTPDVEVSYVWGENVPTDGMFSATLYATEIALGLLGAADCQISDRIQQITRAGETLILTDPAGLADDHKTGITLVDAWITAVNPHQVAGNRTLVRSNDLPTIRT